MSINFIILVQHKDSMPLWRKKTYRSGLKKNIIINELLAEFYVYISYPYILRLILLKIKRLSPGQIQ